MSASQAKPSQARDLWFKLQADKRKAQEREKAKGHKVYQGQDGAALMLAGAVSFAILAAAGCPTDASFLSPKTFCTLLRVGFSYVAAVGKFAKTKEHTAWCRRFQKFRNFGSFIPAEFFPWRWSESWLHR
jgi:hypothetical protein